MLYPNLMTQTFNLIDRLKKIPDTNLIFYGYRTTPPNLPRSAPLTLEPRGGAAGGGVLICVVLAYQIGMTIAKAKARDMPFGWC